MQLRIVHWNYEIVLRLKRVLRVARAVADVKRGFHSEDERRAFKREFLDRKLRARAVLRL
jgi:hypothetical protein